MAYDGGKGAAGVYQWLINMIPPHTRYIDCFLGHSAIMRYKRPAAGSIGIEINPTVLAELWYGRADLELITGDVIPLLERDYFNLSSSDFVYCDPPYLLETRSCQRPLYAFEMADRDSHRRLIAALRSAPAMVMLSGYWSELYADLLSDWRTASRWTVNRAGQKVQEYVWMNYAPPFALHDYQYLGSTFRERERIGRKKERWARKLARMKPLERMALLDAIGDLAAPRSLLAPGPDQAAPLELATPESAMLQLTLEGI